MLSILLIAILAVGVPFFLVCIRSFLKGLEAIQKQVTSCGASLTVVMRIVGDTTQSPSNLD